jgi:hypothetical protein
MKGSRAADATQPDDDCVKVGHVSRLSISRVSC